MRISEVAFLRKDIIQDSVTSREGLEGRGSFFLTASLARADNFRVLDYRENFLP
jgi:hypothetical protein